MKRFAISLAALLTCLALGARKVTFNMADYGVAPGKEQLTEKVGKFLSELPQKVNPDDHIVLKFRKGTYRFYQDGITEREMYISNHDERQPKRVVFNLQGFHNLTLEGGGAEFLFSGIVTPFALNYTEDCRLRNFSIDWEEPMMIPLTVKAGSPEAGITFSVPSWVKWMADDDSTFCIYGEEWAVRPTLGLPFDPQTGHVVYQTGDLSINTAGFKALGGNTFLAPAWKDARLRPGMVVAARSAHRPAPAIFINEAKRTELTNVTVHFAFGMGLLAQRCTDITLRGFRVCLKDAAGSDRLFTTCADATHFSQCRGKITSEGGLYENMMDDAINVHGIYLHVRQREDDHTLLCQYMHEQAWGFNWGNTGDSVQFVHATTMEAFAPNIITGIKPVDRVELRGMRVFRIRFRDALPPDVEGGTDVGLENLTWTPEVTFRRNTVRNNRARGALFSSPRRTICEQNTFDHVSGSAILLCGDCNGWFESGAVRDLVIRKNKFINCLDNYFQFTNAVISICPEIPDIAHQTTFFHGGQPNSIVIEDNTFETFDAPLLYAKSVDGLTWRNNKVSVNTEYQPFHWNKERIRLEHVRCTNIRP